MAWLWLPDRFGWMFQKMLIYWDSPAKPSVWQLPRWKCLVHARGRRRMARHMAHSGHLSTTCAWFKCHSRTWILLLSISDPLWPQCASSKITLHVRKQLHDDIISLMTKISLILLFVYFWNMVWHGSIVKASQLSILAYSDERKWMVDN